MAQHLDALPNPEAPPRGADCIALAQPFTDLVAKFDRDAIAPAENAQLAVRLRSSQAAACQAMMDVSDQLPRSYFRHVKMARSFGFGLRTTRSRLRHPPSYTSSLTVIIP